MKTFTIYSDEINNQNMCENILYFFKDNNCKYNGMYMRAFYNYILKKYILSVFKDKIECKFFPSFFDPMKILKKNGKDIDNFEHHTFNITVCLSELKEDYENFKKEMNLE